MKESVNLMHPDDLEYMLLYLIPRIRNCASFVTGRDWRDFVSDLETAINIAKVEMDKAERRKRNESSNEPKS